MTGTSIKASIAAKKDANRNLSKLLEQAEADNEQLHTMKRDFGRVWNYFRCGEDESGHWAYEGAGADSKSKTRKEPGEQRGAVTGRQRTPRQCLADGGSVHSRLFF